MTPIVATIFSILAIAGIGWAAMKTLRIPLCPICLGVGGTWLWMVIARSLGYPVDTTMLSILLGGSVAGIAYQIEKRLPPGRSPLAWKTVFIPSGFMAAYAIAAPQWTLFALTVAVLVLLTAFFLLPQGASEEASETVEELKKKMQNCC